MQILTSVFTTRYQLPVCILFSCKACAILLPAGKLQIMQILTIIWVQVVPVHHDVEGEPKKEPFLMNSDAILQEMCPAFQRYSLGFRYTVPGNKNENDLQLAIHLCLSNHVHDTSGQEYIPIASSSKATKGGFYFHCLLHIGHVNTVCPMIFESVANNAIRSLLLPSNPASWAKLTTMKLTPIYEAQSTVDSLYHLFSFGHRITSSTLSVDHASCSDGTVFSNSFDVAVVGSAKQKEKWLRLTICCRSLTPCGLWEWSIPAFLAVCRRHRGVFEHICRQILHSLNQQYQEDPESFPHGYEALLKVIPNHHLDFGCWEAKICRFCSTSWQKPLYEISLAWGIIFSQKHNSPAQCLIARSVVNAFGRWNYTCSAVSQSLRNIRLWPISFWISLSGCLCLTKNSKINRDLQESQFHDKRSHHTSYHAKLLPQSSYVA